MGKKADCYCISSIQCAVYTVQACKLCLTVLHNEGPGKILKTSFNSLSEYKSLNFRWIHSLRTLSNIAFTCCTVWIHDTLHTKQSHEPNQQSGAPVCHLLWSAVYESQNSFCQLNLVDKCHLQITFLAGVLEWGQEPGARPGWREEYWVMTVPGTTISTSQYFP